MGDAHGAKREARETMPCAALSRDAADTSPAAPALPCAQPGLTRFPFRGSVRIREPEPDPMRVPVCPAPRQSPRGGFVPASCCVSSRFVRSPSGARSDLRQDLILNANRGRSYATPPLPTESFRLRLQHKPHVARHGVECARVEGGAQGDHIAAVSVGANQVEVDRVSRLHWPGA